MNTQSPVTSPNAPLVIEALAEPSAQIADLRRDYKMASLDEGELALDPITQFTNWFTEAQKAQLLEPNAMTLATVSADGKPSARIVLLKGVDQNGFCFYSNYHSRKGQELELKPQACLVFLWQELERQVRIEGSITKMTAQESDAYFHSRPINSRYGALVSPQSAVISDRTELVQREATLRAEYGDHPPRPEHWGGYRVAPEVVEFWQGRRSRLHDRLRFTAIETEKKWRIERLAP
jgi:pyridoxamine 5'-phosphate oxidase